MLVVDDTGSPVLTGDFWSAADHRLAYRPVCTQRLAGVALCVNGHGCGMNMCNCLCGVLACGACSYDNALLPVTLLSGWFDQVFFARIDYADMSNRWDNAQMEMIWRGSKSLGTETEIFTGVFAQAAGDGKHII